MEAAIRDFIRAAERLNGDLDWYHKSYSISSFDEFDKSYRRFKVSLANLRRKVKQLGH